MAQTAQNVFRKIEEWASGPFIIWVFFAACFLWGIGANHFVEDTYSSYLGLQDIESIYGLVPATWEFTYWTMSLAPQIGQIMFGYLYLSDTKSNKWAALVTAALFLMDFGADVYHRSGCGYVIDQVTSDPNWSRGIIDCGLGFNAKTAWAAGLTLVYFTFGSETFLTVSTGVILTTFPKAVIAGKKVAHDISNALDNYNPSRDRSR